MRRPMLLTAPIFYLLTPISYLSKSDRLGFCILVGNRNGADVSANTGQLAHQVLIAALDMVDAVHLGDALGGQTGDDHGSARPANHMRGPERLSEREPPR